MLYTCAQIEDEIHEGGNPAEFGNGDQPYSSLHYLNIIIVLPIYYALGNIHTGHIARDTTAMRAYEESTIDN